MASVLSACLLFYSLALRILKLNLMSVCLHVFAYFSVKSLSYLSGMFSNLHISIYRVFDALAYFVSGFCSFVVAYKHSIVVALFVFFVSPGSLSFISFFFFHQHDLEGP